MARAKDYSTSWGQHGIVMRTPDTRDEERAVTAMARSVCSLFANYRKKALAKAKALRVAFGSAVKQINETGEKNTMETIKDANGNEAFVHIGSVVYISAAHVAATTVDIGRIGAKCTAKGMGYGSESNEFNSHSWSADSLGKFSLSEWDNRAPSTTVYSTDLPTAQAYLKGTTKVGTLTYDLKIDATSAIEVLEYLKGQLAETKLAVELEASARTVFSDKIEKEILRILERDRRQGGLLWESGTATVGTLQGSKVAPPVKSLDDLAREIYDDRRNNNIVESADARWTESYRLANLRLSLRATAARGEA